MSRLGTADFFFFLRAAVLILLTAFFHSFIAPSVWTPLLLQASLSTGENATVCDHDDIGLPRYSPPPSSPLETLTFSRHLACLLAAAGISVGDVLGT